MFLGHRNGVGEHLLLSVITLIASSFGYAIVKGAVFPGFIGSQVFVTCTLIGKNNTPIGNTARLSVL
ncbi:hypothetical protein Niako_6167 [Niastella koreensis GR20-10]|uniref:Uncharacterized protein n=1 Tax=Niastella koreensis (strain DSM 17620 / KACC 11465 / NBRC 106392 / GR20-10) TaxID=700598 RepID=G8TA20_NIAKG|nr:hypothetical protein Niako_6167 [Niastella koreensis GR20-10]